MIIFLSKIWRPQGQRKVYMELITMRADANFSLYFNATLLIFLFNAISWFSFLRLVLLLPRLSFRSLRCLLICLLLPPKKLGCRHVPCACKFLRLLQVIMNLWEIRLYPLHVLPRSQQRRHFRKLQIMYIGADTTYPPYQDLPNSPF